MANCNVSQFKSDLREIPWETLINENDVQASWDLFKQTLTTIINRHAPLIEKKVKGRDCPWLTHEIKEKMNEQDHLLKKARKSGKECDWCNYRKARNSVTKCIRQHKANYNRSVFRENVNRPKQFWDQIKKCYPTRNKGETPNKLFDVEGKHISDSYRIANTFCNFFTGIGTSIQQCYVTLTEKHRQFHSYRKLQDLINPHHCVFKFKEVTERDILSIIKMLRSSTGSGYDNIPISFIKDDVEKLANVTPIFKSEDRSSMDNYRPISVLPALAKIIERVVHRQLSIYLEENCLLSSNQFGFRKGRSTQQAVTYFSDHIRDCMDKGEYYGAVFIDLKKAFDPVDHGRLLSKLSHYGIKDKELTWFENYLFGRRQRVIYDGTQSDSQPVVCGVPQGSILGPMLFILLINDIDHQLNSCKILLYADDTVVFTSSKNQETIKGNLNTDLSKLATWFYENNLVVNLKKGRTEFILYSTPNKLSKAEKMDIMIRNEPVNEVQAYQYKYILVFKRYNFVFSK
ncbi:Hypothetical predicted protein [Paramuricea clavata]|uniref:Uncharacterized protein n=1 Tax=Paramuricea clavata TaxID=317549 RepID=A0A6S7I735_PARCT|nr:Hypothetical predicted protein [Paramuricea clavata]